MEAGPEIDLGRVMAEIDEEVRRRRASGEIPAGFERELELVFARFAPPGAVGDDLDVLLERAAQSGFINVDVPTASARKGVAPVKKVLRKTMGWYLNYVAQQTSVFASTTVRAMRLLADRVEALERTTPGASPRMRDELARLSTTFDIAPWQSLVVDHLRASTVPGRALHADCGAGSLLAALASEGVDAYGTEPRQTLVDQAVASGHDVRLDEALDHVGALAPGALAGAVLSGCVDRLPVSVLLVLADLVASRLAPGASLVVLGTEPKEWADVVSTVESDLTPGRPLHAETWRHLLAGRGIDELEVVTGRTRGVYAVTGRRA